jgi:hypothetical protein
MGRRPGNTLEKWEVASVKAMLARKYVPQDIQAYFSRPLDQSRAHFRDTRLNQT